VRSPRNPIREALCSYLNRGGLELLRKYPTGTIGNAFDWGEPFVFGMPDGQDRELFREVGLELGETLKVGSPESVRREAALKAMDDAGREQVAKAAATSC